MLLPLDAAGILLVVIEGIFVVGWPLISAAVHSFLVSLGWWLQSHLAGGAFMLIVRGGLVRLTQPIRETPIWAAASLPAVDTSRGSKSEEVEKVWEV